MIMQNGDLRSFLDRVYMYRLSTELRCKMRKIRISGKLGRFVTGELLNVGPSNCEQLKKFKKLIREIYLRLL